jgi:predicted RNA binding protein YcfA (HicA-like mRNA interferase family)
MDSAEVLKRLTRDGWILSNVKGSHFSFTHPTSQAA